MVDAAHQRGRRFVGDPNAIYLYVPAGKPFTVGFTTKNDLDALRFIPLMSLPTDIKVGLSSAESSPSFNWIMATQIEGSAAAYVCDVPGDPSEQLSLITKCDTGKYNRRDNTLERMRLCWEVMAITGAPYDVVRAAILKVGKETAIKSVRLMRWLQSQPEVTTTSQLRTLSHSLSKTHSLSATRLRQQLLSNTPYWDPDWAQMLKILLGARAAAQAVK